MGTRGKGGVGLRISHSLRCVPQAGGDVAGWKPNSIQLYDIIFSTYSKSMAFDQCSRLKPSYEFHFEGL